MNDFTVRFIASLWSTAGEMAPWLLFGFLVAGALHVLVPAAWVIRHLGGRGFGPVVKASLAGVPLPLCSCGVIPVAASLRRNGASRGATTAFLLSTPQTGIDSIFVTWSLLGPVFALFRPFAAFASGLLGGALVDRFVDPAAPDRPDAPAPAACCGEDDAPGDGPGGSPVVRALRYAFVTLPADLAGSLAAGLVIAALIAALLPPDFFAGRLGHGLPAMLAMMLVGIPLYVCATASVPIAASLIARGMSPGAALVFLVTGPATNAATILTIWNTMGRRTTYIYLATVAATGLASGYALDRLVTLPDLPPVHCVAAGSTGPLGGLSAVALLALLVHARLRRRPACSPQPVPAGASVAALAGSCGVQGTRPPQESAVVVPVRGMSCGHCANKVERTLAALPGVAGAAVDLAQAEARVTGPSVDPAALRRAVRELGYETDG